MARHPKRLGREAHGESQELWQVEDWQAERPVELRFCPFLVHIKAHVA